MGRAPCCDKNNVKRGPWAPEEDAKLKAYIEQFGIGGNWIALPQKSGLKRCGKSCRLRWLNYLRPNIKHGAFSEEEDSIICSLYISIGSRWSIIAAQLPGRTDNDIKNYWNTRLKKKLLGKRKQSNINLLSAGSSMDFRDSNSAIERIQLHMQLQSLQNPFSFYTNPLQENMIQQSCQLLCSSPSSYNPLMQIFLANPQRGEGQKAELHQSSIQEHYSLLVDELENSMNGMSSSDCTFPYETQKKIPCSSVIPKSGGGKQSNTTIFQPISASQAELDDILMNDQLGEFNSFNDFDTNSESLNYWDSTSVLHHQSAPRSFIYQNMLSQNS